MKQKLSDRLHVLVMAGGSGTRFWPKSRKQKPKQLLKLWDDKSLIEHTLDRFADNPVWIVTTEKLVEATKDVVGDKYLNVRYLAEPSACNTAACILWGTREIQKQDPNAMIAVMPADHYIGDLPTFQKALETAVQFASENPSLVTLGIRPTKPETGYGYIECEGAFNELSPVFVKQFVEKPDLRTAVRYVESAKFLWNAGMFIFSASTGMKAFQNCMPELFDLFEKEKDIQKVYASIREEDRVSVDYGVMETAMSKGISVAIVPVSCKWNDVGSFPALEEIDRPMLGDVVSLDAPCNIVQTDTGLVALLGVNDLVVVRDKDVVLVTSKDRAQDIKLLLEKVKAKSPERL
ncbi:MAG: mannose-1-phosphate guanylyltransferase [Bacteriovoracia bacterium]